MRTEYAEVCNANSATLDSRRGLRKPAQLPSRSAGEAAVLPYRQVQLTHGPKMLKTKCVRRASVEKHSLYMLGYLEVVTALWLFPQLP